MPRRSSATARCSSRRPHGRPATAAAELYDPATNSWSRDRQHGDGPCCPHGDPAHRTGRCSSTGGSTGLGLTASAELYDPTSERVERGRAAWRQRASTTPRPAWPNGKVLVVGGSDGSGLTASADLYDPAMNSWSAAGSPGDRSRRPYGHAALTGMVLVAGGDDGAGAIATAELYDPAGNDGPPRPASDGPARCTPRLAAWRRRPAGRGGLSGMAVTATAERYDPIGNSWSPAASGAAPAESHTTPCSADGTVLGRRRRRRSDNLASAERYDHRRGRSWSPSMNDGRRANHTATLLGTGKRPRRPAATRGSASRLGGARLADERRHAGDRATASPAISELGAIGGGRRASLTGESAGHRRRHVPGFAPDDATCAAAPASLSTVAIGRDGTATSASVRAEPRRDVPLGRELRRRRENDPGQAGAARRDRPPSWASGRPPQPPRLVASATTATPTAASPSATAGRQRIATATASPTRRITVRTTQPRPSRRRRRRDRQRMREAPRGDVAPVPPSAGRSRPPEAR